MFSVSLSDFDHLIHFALLIRPFCDQLAVTHVGLCHILAQLDAHQLGHQSIHDVLVVSGFVSLFVRQKA